MPDNENQVSIFNFKRIKALNLTIAHKKVFVLSIVTLSLFEALSRMHHVRVDHRILD